MQQLITESRLKHVSICIAILARFEVPTGLWSNFLDIMQNNAIGENQQYRLAAMTTLGHLSEFMEDSPVLSQ